jgi:predicted transcriptional regulator
MNIDNLASVEAERIRGIQQKLPVFIVTSSTLLVAQKVLSEQGLATIPVFNNDNTVVKTAARTDPTMYYLEKGTVINKWGKQSFNKAVTYIKQR